jgi:16S rRNA (guanine527-N7)-methyltransferase
LITESNVKRILVKDLNFDASKIKKLDNFAKKILIFNKKYNLISKNTEKEIWDRHILDSAQLVKFINIKSCSGIADLGTGGGFPGIILAIYFQNFNFHVKLYEKSPVKSAFLTNITNLLGLNCKVICKDINLVNIDSNYIVCRAFKKLPYILNISRENCIKKHKIIIMKGRNAQKEINNTSQVNKYKYKLENSITDKDSKIIILDAE